MARPKKEDREKLTYRITIRFTQEEGEYINRVALSSGLTAAEVVRRKMENLKIPNLTEQQTLSELRVIRNLLAKHGGMFKHIYEQSPEYNRETAAALAEEIIMYGQIERLIQAIEKRFYSTENTRVYPAVGDIEDGEGMDIL